MSVNFKDNIKNFEEKGKNNIIECIFFIFSYNDKKNKDRTRPCGAKPVREMELRSTISLRYNSRRAKADHFLAAVFMGIE